MNNNLIEYPSIINSSKAPRENCVAFEKHDGSNIRVKYTSKNGFELFGSRTKIIDSTHPSLGSVIDVFNREFNLPLTKLFKTKWPDEKEITVFGEFFGDKSFAGQHEPDDQKQFVLFDVLVGHRNRKFLLPDDFIKLCGDIVKIPVVIYRGMLTDDFISDVRNGKYNVFEGVICKGTNRSGAFRGNVWMCKIKTKKYLIDVYNKYGDDGLKKFGE